MEQLKQLQDYYVSLGTQLDQTIDDDLVEAIIFEQMAVNLKIKSLRSCLNNQHM